MIFLSQTLVWGRWNLLAASGKRHCTDTLSLEVCRIFPGFKRVCSLTFPVLLLDSYAELPCLFLALWHGVVVHREHMAGLLKRFQRNFNRDATCGVSRDVVCRSSVDVSCTIVCFCAPMGSQPSAERPNGPFLSVSIARHGRKGHSEAWTCRNFRLLASLQDCLRGCSRSDFCESSFLRRGGLRGCAASCPLFFCAFVSLPAGGFFFWV